MFFGVKAFFGRYFVIVWAFVEFYCIASFGIRMRTSTKKTINKSHDPNDDKNCSVINVTYYKQWIYIKQNLFKISRVHVSRQMYRQIGRFSKHWQRPRDGNDNGPHGQMKLTFFGRCEQYTIDARILKTYCSVDIRDCAIFIWRGGWKTRGAGIT